jgi:hypothetical protein
MPHDPNSALIAVWMTKKGLGQFFAGVPEQPSVYTLRCVSSVQRIRFRFETGNLAGEAKRKYELLSEHGFTVVRVPAYLLTFANSDSNSQLVLIQAAISHLLEIYERGKIIMADYNEQFGRDVLALVASKHPTRVQMMDIKEAMTPEPTDEELLMALDALTIDGYIEGKGQRESSSGKSRLAVMANIISTKAGREHLRPVNEVSEAGGISNLHFHGPVGAVGHQSTGTVSVTQNWISSAPDPNWPVVAEAFKEATKAKATTASSSEDYLTVATLAKAQEQATHKDKTGFLDTISKLGQATLPILASAGAHGLVSYLGTC